MRLKLSLAENEGPGEEEEPPIEPPNGDEEESVEEGDETPDEKEKWPRYLTVERVKANFRQMNLR